MASPRSRKRRPQKGFQQAGSLVRPQIRTVSSSRGFGQSELLTKWAEIAGPETAQIARPVEVSYGRGGLGATLVLLTTGPNAPILEMQKEQIRERVNAIYGYTAISRVRVTQTAPTGFAEGQVAFTPSSEAAKAPLDADALRQSEQAVAPIEDSELRQALELLGANIISRQPN